VRGGNGSGRLDWAGLGVALALGAWLAEWARRRLRAARHAADTPRELTGTPAGPSGVIPLPGLPGAGRLWRTALPAWSAVAAGLLAIGAIAWLVDLASSSARASSHAVAAARADASHARRLAPPDGPLRVLSVSPGPGSARVNGALPIRIALSAPLATGSPLPALHPPVPGAWQGSGRVLTFTPGLPLAPQTRYSLHIPGGAAGIRSAGGRLLARSLTIRFRTEGYSLLRLAQLLAQLGYLPLSWQPYARMNGDHAGGGLAAQEAMAYSPPPGAFIWDGGYPATLRAQWRPGEPNPLITGAVMAFRAQHHLAITAVAGRRLWRALLAAADAGQQNAVGYTYAIARTSSPETLTIWHDGRVVLRSLANTGIPVAPTAPGTYPVYLRLRFQVMQGTNPDGSHYADPVSFVAYFDGGEAVHYFPRYAYGFPQSLGCVELPYRAAERAWPYLTYGSLVTVAG